MKPKHFYTISLITLGFIGVGLFITLATLSIFNQLIADDVSYFRYFSGGEPWGFLYWHYFEHSGRLLQSLLVATGYMLFGDFSVKVFPLLTYIALIASVTWALHRFIPWKKRSLLFSGAAGLAVTSAAILLMPSTYDSYLWWTSSSIYLTSLVMLVLGVCIIDILVQKKHSKIVGWLLLLVLALGQTLSEITSVVFIAGTGLVFLYYLFQKNKEKYLVFLKVTIALIIGFFLTYFSPGSLTRRASDDGSSLGFEFTRIFILSTRHFAELIASLSLWEVSLLAVLGIFIGISIKRLSRKTIKKTLLISLLIAVVGIYGSFCVNNYVWYNMPYRAFTLPSFVFTILLITLFALLANVLFSRFKKSRVGLVIVGLVLVIPTLFGFISYSTSAIHFMSVRDTAYTVREETIKAQQAANVSPIQIESLPILIKSQATDLDYQAEKQISWYESALKGHNGITSEEPIMVMPTPDSYCVFGDSGDVCASRGDETTFRKILHKIDQLVIRYFTLSYS